MPTQLKYSLNLKTEIVALYTTGIPTRALAHYYKVYTDYICRWNKDNQFHINDSTMKDIMNESKTLHESGYSIDEISKKFSLCTDIIYYWIFGKFMNELPHSGIRITDANLKQYVVNDYLNGATMAELSNKYNMSLHIIASTLQECGVTRGEISNTMYKDDIIKLYKLGCTLNEIISKVGCNKYTIMRIINTYGVEFKRKPNIKFYDSEVENNVLHLYVDDKMSSGKIANKLGMKSGTVSRIIRKHGVTRDNYLVNRGNLAVNYIDGRSHGKYCELFDAGFKERTISYWDYKCGICGRDEIEFNTRLSVHHVNDDPQTCCNDSKKLFAPLCRSCHMKITRAMQRGCMDFIDMFEDMINHGSMNGKCYYTFDEYIEKYKINPYTMYYRHGANISKLKKERKNKLASKF